MRLPFVVLSVALVLFLLFPVARASTRIPLVTPSISPLRLAHPLGDAYLLVPPRCRSAACSLIVVSHSRGMTAQASFERAHLNTLYSSFTSAGYAVLVSDDAGARSWGNPQSLSYLGEVHRLATRHFRFSGRTYTFGYSMGGLPALLSAYRGVFPVHGVMLLDARVNLEDAWRSTDHKRRAEIAHAFGIAPTDELPHGFDPLSDYGEGSRIPMFIAGSPTDRTVPFSSNGERLYHRDSRTAQVELLRLEGPHLGGSHWGPEVVGSMVRFVNRLEREYEPLYGDTPEDE
ncbi:alpha/beta hydrolase family protein [Deinobacterium chartae]|nr:alpha/beta hydrolase [Deinobacterium chartae]